MSAFLQSDPRQHSSWRGGFILPSQIIHGGKVSEEYFGSFPIENAFIT